MKGHFKRIKLMKNNYANKSTDNRNALFERVNKSNNDWKVFTWGKNSIIIKKREVLKSEGNTENKSFRFLAKH